MRIRLGQFGPDFLNTPEFKALFEEAAAPAVAANSGKH